MSLISDIKKLRKSEISKTVNKRLKEFKTLSKKGNNEWFSELCFCILTANSKAETAIQIQKNIGAKGFLTLSLSKLTQEIKKVGHRFHNNKAKYIIEARKYSKIKDLVKKELKENKDPREFIVKKVKGIGWKESSHFLRNVGFSDYAILDRHILNMMCESKIIKEKPKILNEKNYFEIEKKFKKIININADELDLYVWYLKTNKVLK
ncbi:N-glycosylase/DNA lyase [Candidatus Woesearchaeota archaeon]|nr:N-glycosylase/DNA lyase [Candidatus Woesearchaeota archaeon]